MTPHEQLLRDVEEQESWLRSACADPICARLGEIQSLVRAAVDEERAARRCADRLFFRPERDALDIAGITADPSADGAGAAHCKRRPRVGPTIGVGLAAAAGIVVAVGLYHLPAGEEELPLVSAFEQYADDEVDRSLMALDDDLSVLESALAAQRQGHDDGGLFEGALDSETDADDDEPSPAPSQGDGWGEGSQPLPLRSTCVPPLPFRERAEVRVARTG